MKRQQNRRRNARHQILTEAMEPRILFAYPQMTAMAGAANPMNGVNIGQFSNPAFGDVDSDGDLDVVVGQSEFLRYFRNTGTATAPVYTQIIGSQNPFSGLVFGNVASNPALGDIDGDRDLDLVLGSGAGTRYFRNEGSATGPFYNELTGANNPVSGVVVDGNSAPTLADVDSDGDLDIFEGDSGGLMRYWKNNGTVTAPNFQFTSSPFSGMDFGDNTVPAAGDMDGDGDVDLMIGAANGAIQYFKNIGSATAFNYVQQTATANPFNGVAVPFASPAIGDVDGDGDLDVLTGSQAGTLNSYRNGSSVPAVNYLSNAPNPFNGVNVGGLSHPAFGDLDGDGDLDAVVGQSQFLRYFKNTGTAIAPVYVQQIGFGFNPFLDLALGNSTSNPALADMEADGDLDLVLGSGAGTRYFRNTGSATSAFFSELTGAANPVNGVVVDGNSAPALADLDGDGDRDILEGDSGGLMRYWRNTGAANNPVFQFTTSPFSGMDFGDDSAPATGDMDGDGDFDVLVGNSTGAMRYFKNTGTANSFAYLEQTGAANPLNGVSIPGAAPAAADLDGDGDQDVLAGSQVGTLSYFRANRAPIVGNAIPDQTFTGAGAQSYTVPADTFIDLEGNALTYSATQTSGVALPAWLSFNSTTRTFSGNPTAADASPLQIRVTANDGNGGGSFDDFQLTLTNVADNSLVVNTTADENNGDADPMRGTGTSLREAINYAQTLGGNPSVTFAASLTSGGAATITLGGTELAISSSLTITGPAANLLAISGNNASRVFNISGGGTVTINGLTIRNGAADVGAGVANSGTNLNLNAVTLSNNAASAFGGGLASPGGGTITITNSSIINNTAGNEGGGIENQGVSGSAGSITLINSSLAGNTANGSGFGGAFSNVASGATAAMTLRDCTLAANSGANGAGVLNAVNSGSAVVTYIGTIFANNGINVVNFGGTVTSLGHNLSTDGTGNLTGAGDLPNTNPQLGALSFNGGTTQTMALLSNSPAINAGVAISGITTDQRGTARPQGASPDIGAYERVATTATLTTIAYEYDTRQAVTFDFTADASVTFSRSNFSVQNLTTGQTLSPSVGSFSFNAAGTQAALVLTGLLPAGNYRVTSGTSTLDFFVLVADANRDRHVDAVDQAILTLHLNQPGNYSAGDFNFDGTVTAADQAILDTNLKLWLPAPGTVAALPATSGNDAYALKVESAALVDAYAGTTATGTPAYRIFIGATGAASSIAFNGLGGNDTLAIVGTSGVDTANIGPSTISFGAPVPATYASVETVNFDGAGGFDNLTVSAGTTVNFPTTQHFETLTINGNAIVAPNVSSGLGIVTRALAITGSGVLDLNDNDLVVDYSGASQLAAVQTLIQTARAGGAWTGVGITSNSAKNATPKNTTLGVIEASDFKSVYGPSALFNGEAIDATAVLVKYTYYGDVDFNGVVDFDDYSRIDAGFNNNRSGWFNGDVDGNSIVDFDDYSLIDQAFNTQSGTLRPAALPQLQPGASKPSLASK